jgi:hypothetical protein
LDSTGFLKFQAAGNLGKRSKNAHRPGVMSYIDVGIRRGVAVVL